MSDFPPFTIFLFLEDHQTDDCSELTGPYEDDETSQTEEEGDFSRIMAMMEHFQFDPPRPSSDGERIFSFPAESARTGAGAVEVEAPRAATKGAESEGAGDARVATEDVRANDGSDSDVVLDDAAEASGMGEERPPRRRTRLSVLLDDKIQAKLIALDVAAASDEAEERPRPRRRLSLLLDEKIAAKMQTKEEKSEKHEPTDAKAEVDPKGKNLEEKQEVRRLRLQIAKQNEMLNLLSSKLTQCQRENQVLKAKEACLTDELAHARDEARLLLRGGATESNAGESMQMLLNTNARLRADNDRLRESLKGARKSQQCHTKFDRGMKRANEDIRKLRQEENRSEKQIAYSSRKDSAETKETTNTLLTSDSATGGNLCQDHDIAHAAVDGSRLRLPSMNQRLEKFGFFLSGPTSRRNSLPSPAAKDMQKEIGLKDHRGGTGDKVTNTVGEKVTAYNKSEGLLVDIVERRRCYPAAA